ncbi:MAG: zeta toxin family protein [Bacteroidota bacterium]
MLGDVLLITDKHREAAAAILQKVLEIRKPKMIIAISGESGSGKSELSHVLAKEMRAQGILTKIMHIDNYYRIHPLQRKEWRISNGIENVVGYGEYDWDTIYRNIQEFREGKTATMPCVDLVTEQVDQLITDFKDIEALVIDGLYAIKTEGTDLNVFIELTYHETKKAQVVRGKEPQNEYRARVLEQEHKMVQALRPRAHLLVTKEYQVVKAD